MTETEINAAIDKIFAVFKAEAIIKEKKKR